MPLIYVQIHAYTCIYQRIHTYTYIYMKIRMLNDKVWIVGRCQCPAVTRTRCRPAPDTDWDCQWAARWPLTGHQSPAASGPGRLDAAESLTVTVTHTFNQPKSDGRPAAGPPAPGGGLPLSRAGRSSARLMSGRTEHIKQIQFYGSVSSVAQAFVFNMWNNYMMIQTEPTWLYTLGLAVDHENSYWNVTGSRLCSDIFLSPTFLIVTLPGQVTAQ